MIGVLTSSSVSYGDVSKVFSGVCVFSAAIEVVVSMTKAAGLSTLEVGVSARVVSTSTFLLSTLFLLIVAGAAKTSSAASDRMAIIGLEGEVSIVHSSRSISAVQGNVVFVANFQLLEQWHWSEPADPGQHATNISIVVIVVE
jgi:hypothetical protein